LRLYEPAFWLAPVQYSILIALLKYIPTHTKVKGKMKSDNGSQKDKDLAWNIVITQHFTVYTWLAKSFMPQN